MTGLSSAEQVEKSQKRGAAEIEGYARRLGAENAAKRASAYRAMVDRWAQDAVEGHRSAERLSAIAFP